MSENIQSKLFNGFLAWNNNEIVWFRETTPETTPETQPEQPPAVLDILVNEGQLYFDLGEHNETTELA